MQIIAEAGVNHLGSLGIAMKMIDAASDSGVDAIKFQSFDPEQLVIKNAPKAQYQIDNTGDGGGQLEMLQKLALSPASHKVLIEYCKGKSIEFLSTPFDLKSLTLLDSFDMPTIKVSSGDLTNLPLLRAIGARGRRVILSTGMATLDEIGAALDVLVQCGTPWSLITVLQCNTQYPTPMPDANLMAMLTIRDTFKVSVGYSDHTLGIEAPIAAVAMGAAVIEKHFTLDRNMPGPDHKASLLPDELAAMVRAIRNIEAALGDGKKHPTASETPNIPIARKSIVASTYIKAGERLTPDNITTKRPATGLSPMLWDSVIGTSAKRDYQLDDLIEL